MWSEPLHRVVAPFHHMVCAVTPRGLRCTSTGVPAESGQHTAQTTWCSRKTWEVRTTDHMVFPRNPEERMTNHMVSPRNPGGTHDRPHGEHELGGRVESRKCRRTGCRQRDESASALSTFNLTPECCARISSQFSPSQGNHRQSVRRASFSPTRFSAWGRRCRRRMRGFLFLRCSGLFHEESEETREDNQHRASAAPSSASGTFSPAEKRGGEGSRRYTVSANPL
jgi:hypothetical protein